MKNSVTLHDIAKVVGLSANTVSRALNNKAGVSAETKEKISKIAKEMGYQPNAMARTLRGISSNLIGVIIDDNTNPYLAEVLKSIEEETRKRNYHILLFNSSFDTKREIEALRILAGIQACGVIMHPSSLNTQVEEAINNFYNPVVIFGISGSKLITDTVRNDNYFGMREMMRHLLSRNYKKIAFLNLPSNLSTTKERKKGVLAALSEAGYAEDYIDYHEVDFTDGAYAITKQLISKPDHPDCILCGCDMFAAQSMIAISDKGYSIPEDIAVAGYDNIAFSRSFRASLTTVSQPKKIIGQQCVDLLEKRIKKELVGDPVEIVLHPELIVRESTGIKRP